VKGKGGVGPHRTESVSTFSLPTADAIVKRRSSCRIAVAFPFYASIILWLTKKSFFDFFQLLYSQLSYHSTDIGNITFIQSCIEGCFKKKRNTLHLVKNLYMFLALNLSQIYFLLVYITS
jgi:hypothetical protein